MSEQNGHDPREPKRRKTDQDPIFSLRNVKLVCMRSGTTVLEELLGRFHLPQAPFFQAASFDYDGLGKALRERLDTEETPALELQLGAKTTVVKNERECREALAALDTNPAWWVYGGDGLYNLRAEVVISRPPEPPAAPEPISNSQPAVPHDAVVIDLCADASEADESDESDHVVEDIQVEALPSCDQFQPGRWARICQLFGHPAKYTTRQEGHKYHFLGTNLQLHPYQLYACGWMLDQAFSGDLYGGIIADDMGLGKTFEAIGYHVARSQLLDCQADVALHPGRHLPPDAQPTRQKCPSDFKFGVQCVCQQSGVSHEVVEFLHGGPTVIVSPIIGLQQAWFPVLYDTLNLEEARGKTRLHLFVSADTSSGDPRMQRFLRGGYVPDLEAVAKTAKKKEYTLRSKAGQYHNIMLLNHQMVPTLRRAFRWKQTLPEENKLTLMPGVFLLDEVHLYKGTKAKPAETIRLMNDTIRSGRSREGDEGADFFPNPMAFGLSGTPAEKSPADFSPLIDSILLGGYAWDGEGTKRLTLQEVGELTKVCERLQREGRGNMEDAEWKRQVKQYQVDLQRVCSKFMIRRTRLDHFYGDVVCDESGIKPGVSYHLIPQGYHQHVRPLVEQFNLTSQTQLDSLVDQWKANGSVGSKPTMDEAQSSLLSQQGSPHLRNLRICSSFPAVAKHLQPGGLLCFDAKAIHKVLCSIKGEEDARGTRYYEAIDDLVDGCGKMKELVKIIEQMKRQCTPHKFDNETLTRNMVVFCTIPANLLLIYLYLLKHDKEVELCFAHGALKTGHRSDIIRLFREFQGSGPSGSKPRILLTSTIAVGTGVGLQRANFAVSFDLPFRAHQLAQSLARVSRTGQAEPTFIYLFVGGGVKGGEESIWEKLWTRHRLNSDDAQLILPKGDLVPV